MFKKAVILRIVLVAMAMILLIKGGSLMGESPGSEIKNRAREKLSHIKIASIYQRITDYIGMGKDVNYLINLFKETQTELILRGFWRWHYPVPDSGGKHGYDYQTCKKTIEEIKKEIPEIIFCGAVPAQHLPHIAINPKTGNSFSEKELREMALNPSNWKIDFSFEELQGFYAERILPEQKAYFPDITRSAFQKLFLSWIKKQIDCGVDAIWIDGFFGVLGAIKKTGKLEPSDIRKVMAAASHIVEEIRAYGYSEYGKYIYVGTWGWPLLDYSDYSLPDLDFVTFTPKGKEIKEGTFDEEFWGSAKEQLKKAVGWDIPVLVYIDWSPGDDAPLSVFSQKLSTEQQNELLGKMDLYFAEKGINYVYSIHGGYMGQGAKKLLFGQFNVYDSIAFGNYETIKNLAQTKAKKSFLFFMNP